MGAITWTKMVPDELLTCAARRPKIARARVHVPGAKRAFPEAVIGTFKWMPGTCRHDNGQRLKRKTQEPDPFFKTLNVKAARKKAKIRSTKAVRFLVPPAPTPPPPYSPRAAFSADKPPLERWPMPRQAFTFTPPQATVAAVSAGAAASPMPPAAATPPAHAPFPLSWGEIVMGAIWAATAFAGVSAIPGHDKVILFAAALALQSVRCMFLALRS